ncbi:MAG TPA: hypothetical protein PKY86_07325 [Niabella sp.]|nr:hypothetical protein [Niabella sp.]HRB34254.1 hypothetical protein [Niabella sp.]HRB57964.1 hypothetical protein [Niabella sp.]HRB63478.1 hypothetical protein [Niabella sp.]HRB73934.1 hypothetical protein [Niabella sp.]
MIQEFISEEYESMLTSTYLKSAFQDLGKKYKNFPLIRKLTNISDITKRERAFVFEFVISWDYPNISTIKFNLYEDLLQNHQSIQLKN